MTYLYNENGNIRTSSNIRFHGLTGALGEDLAVYIVDEIEYLSPSGDGVWRAQEGRFTIATYTDREDKDFSKIVENILSNGIKISVMKFWLPN